MDEAGRTGCGAVKMVQFVRELFDDAYAKHFLASPLKPANALAKKVGAPTQSTPSSEQDLLHY